MPPNTRDRIPPQSPEAEMAVLGAMLIERDALERSMEILKEEHFYSSAHRLIFFAMRALGEKDRAVDLITLTEELKRTGKLADAGGETYLSELIEKVSTAAHVTHYADIVRYKATMRDLINAATGIVESCFKEDCEPEVMLDRAQERIFAVSQTQAVKGFSDAIELSHKVMERIEAAHNKKEAITGVPTGFLAFDDKTGGLQKSDFIILAARPSQGKTAMALNIAYHAAVKKRIPVAMFSLEMSKESIFERMVCGGAYVNLHEVRSGMFKKEKWVSLTQELSKLSASDIYIDDTPGLTVTEMRMRTRRLAADLVKKNKALGLVIIDYIQLMQGGRRSENRQQEVSEISRQLKDLARTLDLPVLALSQLNRRTEDRSRESNRPQISDLRESGSLEQDADIVALIHREEYYRRDDPAVRGQATLILAKQRNGPTGDVDLNFHHEYTLFTNPAPRSAEFSGEPTMLPS
ncbi:MAG: replicative DNA helicase [Elusimicrobiales bacterium]|nr:replicative DNA helicase [Elusimicrobiales bacterium]